MGVKDEIEIAVLDELAKCTRKDNPGAYESFIDLGMDIIDLCEFAMRVELRLKVMLPAPKTRKGGERRWKFKDAKELIDYIYGNSKKKIIETIQCPRCKGKGLVRDKFTDVFTFGINFLLETVDDNFKMVCPKCDGMGEIRKVTIIEEETR